VQVAGIPSERKGKRRVNRPSRDAILLVDIVATIWLEDA